MHLVLLEHHRPIKLFFVSLLLLLLLLLCHIIVSKNVILESNQAKTGEDQNRPIIIMEEIRFKRGEVEYGEGEEHTAQDPAGGGYLIIGSTRLRRGDVQNN